MIILSLILLLSDSAAAPLTLSDAASLAARTSAPVAVSEARRDEARARAGAVKARLGPALELETGSFATDDPATSFALALKQRRFSFSEFVASDPNSPGTTKDWNAAVMGSWVADLGGASRGAARAAETSADASERQVSRDRDGAAFQAILAFSRAWRSETRLVLLASRLEDAEKDVALADSRNQEGLTTAADPARARAALSEIRAEAAAERGAIASARADLAALIGLENASRPLAPLPAPSATAARPARERDDAAAARLAVAAARAAEDAASGGRWPSLVLQGRYEAHAPQPSARWEDSWSAAAFLRVTLFASGAVDARVAETRSVRLEAEALERQTLATVEAEVASARAALEAAEARRQSFEEATGAAHTALEVQRARYEEGAASLGDLLEARAADLRARLGASSARAEYAAAAARWRLAIGLTPHGEGSP